MEQNVKKFSGVPLLCIVEYQYLDPDSTDGEEGGGVLLDLALGHQRETLLLRGHVLDSVEEGVVLGQHLVVIHHQAAQYLRNSPFKILLVICEISA
jgi:hypothetical protein